MGSVSIGGLITIEKLSFALVLVYYICGSLGLAEEGRLLLLFFRNFLLGSGIVFCLIGAAVIFSSIPNWLESYNRGIADLQSDANKILLGIAWILGGIASGVFALAFSPATKFEAEIKPVEPIGEPEKQSESSLDTSSRREPLFK